MRAVAVPFRLSDIDAVGDDWRRDFAWSVPVTTLFGATGRLLGRWLDLTLGLEANARDVALLGNGATMAAAALTGAALAVAGETANGIRFLGPPVLDAFRGSGGVDWAGSGDAPGIRPAPPPVRHRWLRRIARTASWTAWHRLPATLLAPDAEVLSHNALLIDVARRHRARLRFDHAEARLARCLEDAAGDPGLLGTDAARDRLTARYAERVTDENGLDPDLRTRLRAAVASVVGPAVQAADGVLGGLERSPRVPRRIWSSTGGKYEARALGIASLRRGGEVRRFDHGGTMDLLVDPNLLAGLELGVSSSFVMPTPRAAATAAAAVEVVRPIRRVEILGGHGDPALRTPAPVAKGGAHRRPRVLFVGTAYYGFRQTFPPLPPGPVYLDWQHRILAKLARLPIDLLHKPHPEGICPGGPPELAVYAPVAAGRFESVLEWADVFVFDFPASTTFSIALGTDRPIVLLDFGSMAFNAVVEGAVRSRVRFVPVVADDRNRLTVDDDTLAEAVCGNANQRVDPAFFRALFLGEGG